MNKETVLTRIKQKGIVAVVRGNNEEEACQTVERCLEGGVDAIELTFTVPFAHRLMEQLARRYGEKIVLGAGTVLDAETARTALLCGAEFVVSPHLNPDVIRLCNRYRKVCAAGFMTPTEAVNALECGADLLKLFPGEAFGPSFLKAIKAPLPQADIMPTGGVNIQNAGEWIKAGATALGAGGCLTRGDVAANARAFLAEIEKARG